MFGQPMKTETSHRTPEWMKKIASDIVSQDEDKRPIDIYWFPSKQYCYGCANVRGGRCIELHTSDDGSSCPSAIMVLLHEIAHVLAPWSSPNVQNIRSGFHGIRFWMKAQQLYQRYGQLDYASRNDGYKCGRDFMVKILAGEIDDVFTTPDESVWQLDFKGGNAELIRKIIPGRPGYRPMKVRKIKLVGSTYK